MPSSNPVSTARCPRCGLIGTQEEVACPSCGIDLLTLCPHCSEPFGPSVTPSCPGCGGIVTSGTSLHRNESESGGEDRTI